MTLHATDPRSGFFRFLHHDMPIEYSANVDERIAYIRAEKPLAERAGRLAAHSISCWKAWRAKQPEKLPGKALT